MSTNIQYNLTNCNLNTKNNNTKYLPIINCRIKNLKELGYNNLKEWINDKNNVYIGRAGIVFIHNKDINTIERYPKTSSAFANPFKIGKDGTRDAVLTKYETYITTKLDNDIQLRQALINLRGKSLGCWCYPDPCHGDVLIKLIDKYIPTVTCDWCEMVKASSLIYECKNCKDYILCNTCLYGDDVTPEGVLHHILCCDEPKFD